MLVVHFDKEKFDGEWPPVDAERTVAWFQEKLESIPAEFRHTAKIEFESASGYEGDHYARIVITYMRPETAQESAERNARDDAMRRMVEASERAELARLQAKYGAGG